MPLRRMGRPGLIGMAARTAVVAGTATAVSGSVQRHQQEKAQGQYDQQQAEAAQQQAQVDEAARAAAAQYSQPAPDRLLRRRAGGGADIVAELHEARVAEGCRRPQRRRVRCREGEAARLIADRCPKMTGVAGQADAAARAATRSAWWIAATSGCARRRDLSAFSPYSAWIGFAGSCVTPRASAARSVGRSMIGSRVSSAGLKKNGTEMRSSGYCGEIDPVIGRDEVALSRVLEQFADVDDERTGDRGRIDPLAVALDLQAALAGLDPQQREHAGVLVGADALLRGRVVLAGVADDLDQRRGLAEVLVEVRLGRAESDAPTRAAACVRRPTGGRATPTTTSRSSGWASGHRFGSDQPRVVGRVRDR